MMSRRRFPRALPPARARLAPLVLAALAAATGCADDASDAAAPATTPVPPRVTDDRTDLVLSWFGDGGAHVASSVAEVPPAARPEVRVQDPSVPPEQRDPRWIFLADLRSPTADGSYPVRVELRDSYEARRRPPAPPIAPAPSGPTAIQPSVPGAAPVTMYATRHCPVCKQARRWLLEQKIPFVERDIEREPAAAAELQQKGRAQGVPTSGVPIFEIGGRLIPGFDPPQIRKLLDGAPSGQQIRI